MERRLIPFFLLFLTAFAVSASSDYKEAIARQVFDRLVLARGDFGLPAPNFEMVENDREVARFEGRTIYLGVRAYDLCATYGADSLNALAILLSHEVVHYYAGHTWEKEFSREFAGTELPKEVQDSWLEDEVQADLWGGLLAYTAGYDVRNVATRFFPDLYKTFQRDESLPGYQKLSDRVQLARRTGEKVQQLVHFFETANYLVGIGMYEDALAYYQVILEQGYRSRELYNNIGVYFAHAAILLFRKTEMPYGYPLELDAESRIGRGTRGGEDMTDRKRREQLLRESLQYFEKARSLDPGYTTALINQACVYTLLGASMREADADEADLNFIQAHAWAKKAEREAKGNRKALADIRVLRGLLSAMQDEKEEAREWWEKADSPLAKTNLQVLEKGSIDWAPVRLARSNEREMIEDQSLDLFMRQMPCDTLIGLAAEGQKVQWGVSVRKLGLEHSTVYLHAFSPARYAVLQVVKPGYSGQTLLGIRLGDSREKVLEVYKTPDLITQLTDGEFMYFPAREILFRIDAEGRVAGWCVFRKGQP